MSSEPQQTHLLIIEDDKGRRGFILDGPKYSIGRDPNCDIRLVSQFVSRRHATLVKKTNEDGTYYYRIVDGNLKGQKSSNGLLINSRKRYKHNLQDQDEVVFGPKVSATYRLLKRDAMPTIPPEPDEFDITLISPNMVGYPEDEPLDDDLLEDEPLEDGSPKSSLENEAVSDGDSSSSHSLS